MAEPETTAEQTVRTNGWGIDLNYKDALGKWHETPPGTIQAIFESMGGDAVTIAPQNDPAVIVLRTGEQRKFASSGTVVLEHGETITFESRLPADLPSGYHELRLDGAEQSTRLIVSPGKCWIPENLQTWGWAVQLYAARSRESWGMGDLSDLKRLAFWSAKSLGAGMLMVNPLSAATPTAPQEASPYYPTSRRFFNPLWIHVEDVPGASTETIPQLEELARAGQALNKQPLIDRDKVFALKMRALEMLWLEFTGNSAFDCFCDEQGLDLHRFGVFCALAELYKTGWHRWPEQHRHPAGSAVAQFARENENRVRFHKWLQWLFDRQLARCGNEISLVQDLPIGVNPDGADAWAWQDVFAKDVGVGAPPDEFNTQGQNWGLPPFVPHKLRDAGYEPFIQTIRAAFRNGGGLRIDHVMGLFRLFWIPNGMKASQGAFVRYDADEMLAILALESERAGAYVVGEDLGTTEENARQKLAQHRVMSYRLLWFEKDATSTYPREALAAVTTHDLPTVAGLWTGSDLRKQRDLKLQPNEESTNEICERLMSMANLDPEAPLPEVIAGAYRLLANAPSRILTASLEDAAAVEDRPNMPATRVDQHPNWCVGLPLPIEELMERDLPKQIAAALARGSATHTAAR